MLKLPRKEYILCKAFPTSQQVVKLQSVIVLTKVNHFHRDSGIYDSEFHFSNKFLLVSFADFSLMLVYIY